MKSLVRLIKPMHFYQVKLFMTKPALLLIAIFISLLACKQDDGSAPVDQSGRSNILLIIADDMGIDATPGYDIGDTKPHMPHLDQLASEGVTFDNVWAYPLCAPTRASILTGRYGFRTGVLDVETTADISPDEKTLQAYLDENTGSAYSHAIIGKWHLSNNDALRPTQMGVGTYAGILGGGVQNYDEWALTQNQETKPYSGYATTKLTDLAIDWIGAQNQPWFCWLAYNTPHTPFHLPDDSLHSQGSLPDDQSSIDANPLPYYMAMIESLDSEIGRLLQSIPTEELNQTTIIFIGDNGTASQVIQSPYESIRSKGSLYQGGVHVPMIVSGHQVSRSNVRDNNLIGCVDLFSTIAELAGINSSKYQDSESFKSVLSDETAVIRAFNYIELLNSMPNKSGYAIRNHRYKLIEFDSGQRRFYDLIDDAYENNNLLNGTLTSDQQTALAALENEANALRQ
jgi:arylsulfatase A-like enzyme